MLEEFAAIGTDYRGAVVEGEAKVGIAGRERLPRLMPVVFAAEDLNEIGEDAHILADLTVHPLVELRHGPISHFSC